MVGSLGEEFPEWCNEDSECCAYPGKTSRNYKKPGKCREGGGKDRDDPCFYSAFYDGDDSYNCCHSYEKEAKEGDEAAGKENPACLFVFLDVVWFNFWWG